MRRALTGLALLHGATLLALAWLYAGDAATLEPNQRSFGSVMLGLAGAMMLIGAWVVRRTPALAIVPFGLAGLLALLARAPEHGYLYAHGGWALILGVLAIVMARRSRRPIARAAPPPTDPVEPAPIPGGPEPPETTELAGGILRQIPRFRSRRAAGRTSASVPGTARARTTRPRAMPVTRPVPGERQPVARSD